MVEGHGSELNRFENDLKMRLKIGRFRIIYRVASKRVVEIVAMGPRRIIYEETYRLLKKLPTAGGIKSRVCRQKGPI